MSTFALPFAATPCAPASALEGGTSTWYAPSITLTGAQGVAAVPKLFLALNSIPNNHSAETAGGDGKE